MPAGAESLEAMKAREFLQKGNIHLTRLEFQAALDAYTECLLLEPNNRTAKENIVLTHNNWGIYWFQKRKYKEAREEWEQALKLNPADRNARNNMQILRVTLSRQGLTDEGEKKQPPAKANSDFPPSQAIILTPGIKSGNSASSAAGGESGSSTAPAIASPNTGSASDSAGTSGSGSGAAIIIRSSNSGSATTSGGGTAAGSSGVNSTGSSGGANGSSGGANGSSGGANGNNTAGTDNSAANATFSNNSGVSTYSDPAPGKFTTAPASTPSASATATAGGSQGDNIEDSLGQIELKIYGRKQDSLPIMKRLEKLETDTHGKTKSGTIKERIDTLRKSYGF
ncbi:MAG: hypothetical protein C0507_05955 [Cyanobacteria bacterium PR.3.49]|nr:hypothetical protein [Cyanobacteria bacterium PR.3.49]